MSFYRKYELERLVQKAEPKTFRAREVAGGRAVYLHLLAGMDVASRANLLEKARGLAAAGNPAILDVDDNEFAPYVVTGVLDDFDGLPAWLSRLPLPAPPPPLPPDARPTETMAVPFVPPPPPKQPAAQSEFRPRPVVASPRAPAPAPAPAARAPVPPPTPVASPVPAPPPVPLPRAPGPPAVASASVPSPMSSASVMPAAAAAPSREAGEFTRLFGGSPPERREPSPMPAAANPAPLPTPSSSTARASDPPLVPSSSPVYAAAAKPGAEPGDFTRLFAGSEPPPPSRPDASPMPPAAAGGSEFSRLFGPGPVGQAPPPATGQEPGEFSRLFGPPPGTPADHPVGFSTSQPARQRPPEEPLPWEPQTAAPPQPIVPAQPVLPPRPMVETPDSQKMEAYAPPPLPPAPARPGNSGPGEFTRFFDSPLAASSLPIEDIEQGRMPEARGSADRPFEGPGEFTKWFGKSVPGDSAPPPALPAQHPTFAGRATGLFETPEVPRPASGSTPAVPSGPSEYTGVMAAPRIDEPAVYVPGVKPGRGPLIAVILVVLVVLMLAAVLFVVSMRPR